MHPAITDPLTYWRPIGPPDKDLRGAVPTGDHIWRVVPRVCSPD